MRLTIFGASGGVGRELVSQALEAGHAVRAVHRAGSSRDPLSGVEYHQVDDLWNASDVATAVGGCDVVLSAVGLRRANPNNPWSKIVSPANLNEGFARTLVEVLPRDAPRARLMVVSAAGVGDSRPRMSAALRWMFDHSNIGVAYADLEKMEAILRASALDWMAVRPVTLANGPATGRVKVVDRYRLAATIRRSDVAAWMLGQLAAPAFEHRTPMIAG